MLLFQKLPDYSAVERSLLPLILMRSRVRKSTYLMIPRKRYKVMLKFNNLRVIVVNIFCSTIWLDDCLALRD